MTAWSEGNGQLVKDNISVITGLKNTIGALTMEEKVVLSTGLKE